MVSLILFETQIWSEGNLLLSTMSLLQISCMKISETVEEDLKPFNNERPANVNNLRLKVNVQANCPKQTYNSRKFMKLRFLCIDI